MQPDLRNRKGWLLAVALSLALHAILLAAGYRFLPGLPNDDENGCPQASGVLNLIGEEPGLDVVLVEAKGSPAGAAKDDAVLNAWPSQASDKSHSPVAEPGGPLTGNNSGAAQSANAGHGQGVAGGGTTSFFQVVTTGKRVVYVIDTSMSMGKNNALAVACSELLGSVQKLPATARFQVIVYNSRPNFLLPRLIDWLPSTADTISLVAEALGTLSAEGSTDHLPALQKALALQPDTIYFLTDADDLTEQQLRQATALNRGRAAIHTIELTLRNRHRAAMPLQLLARQNKGKYQAVDVIP